MVISNDVQVMWSWPVAWIFAYRIKTWHISAGLGHPQPVKGLEKLCNQLRQKLKVTSYL